MNEHAVVIGGSVAGLLAAKVLSAHFKCVTILEKDDPFEAPAPRKGAPQGHHAHLLLKGGALVFDALFPGFTEEIIAAGALQFDMANDLSWLNHGSWKKRHSSRFYATTQSRPFLEFFLYKRLMQESNVEMRFSTRMKELLLDERRTKVVGVQTDSEKLSADLVVDASGHLSFAYKWLTEHGYSCETDRMDIHLRYASCVFETDADFTPETPLLLVHGTPPHQKYGGTILPIEGNRWIVSLYEYFGGDGKAVRTEEEFVAFAERFKQPQFREFLLHAKPLTEIYTYQVPAMVRHRFESMRKIPSGLVVVGDAFCRFDPVFGQGMTVAALGVLALKEGLEKGSLAGVHRQIAKQVDVPWGVTTGELLRYAETIGKRTARVRFQQWYIKKIYDVSAYDASVYDAFIQVMSFLKKPSALFHPKILLRVLRDRS